MIYFIFLLFLYLKNNRKHNSNVPLYILSSFLKYLLLQNYFDFEALSICREEDYSYLKTYICAVRRIPLNSKTYLYAVKRTSQYFEYFLFTVKNSDKKKNGARMSCETRGVTDTF